MKIIIDGGASNGCFTNNYITNFDNKIENKYFLFEPQSCFFDDLKTLKSRSDNIEIFSDCIWNEDKNDVNFYLHGDSSSLVAGHNLVKTNTIDIVKFIKQKTSIDDEIIFKTDTEGAEFYVLPHLLKSDIISRIKTIHCETHIRINEYIYAPMFYEIRKEIEKHNIIYIQLG